LSDLSAFNEALNKRAGRKLLPSIAVGLTIIAICWFSLAYQRSVFAAIVAIAASLGIRELARAFGASNVYVSVRELAVASGVLSASAWFGGINGLAISAAIAFTVLLISLLRRGSEGFVASATATTLSLIYLPFMAGFLILLARPFDGFERVMTFIVLVGCNDTFGYLVGVLFGKHTLAPKISPKKSWEGLAGSVIFTAIGGALSFNYILDTTWWYGIVAGLMINVTAVTGDLIESALKRDMSLKDMGSLLPGHGGMLDRLDSVLLSAPALWLALELVKRYL
jgi:phosphatidate cytidylyltransferase